MKESKKIILKSGTYKLKAYLLNNITSMNELSEKELIKLIKENGYTDSITANKFGSWVAWQVTTFTAIPHILKEGIKIPESEKRLWKNIYTESSSRDEIDKARGKGIYFWDENINAEDYIFGLKESFEDVKFGIVGFRFPSEKAEFDPETNRDLGDPFISEFKDWKEFIRYKIDRDDNIKLGYYTEKPIPLEDIYCFQIGDIVYYDKEKLSNNKIPSWLKEIHDYWSSLE